VTGLGVDVDEIPTSAFAERTDGMGLSFQAVTLYLIFVRDANVTNSLHLSTSYLWDDGEFCFTEESVRADGRSVKFTGDVKKPGHRPGLFHVNRDRRTMTEETG